MTSIATPVTVKRGWMARLHYLTRTDGTLRAAQDAGLTSSPRTLRAWLRGERRPSKASLERIEQAYRQVRQYNAPDYRMATDESEQLRLWFLIRHAIDRRSPVRLSYFERRKDDDGRIVPDLYVKITRVIEPHDWEITSSGQRLIQAVDRAPEGPTSPKGPDYRSFRADRVAVTRGSGKILAHVMATYGYLCPTMLDGERLFPRKRIPKDLDPGTPPAGYEHYTERDWAALVV